MSLRAAASAGKRAATAASAARPLKRVKHEGEPSAPREYESPALIVHAERARKLNSCTTRADGRCVVYWMSRDQRIMDNWALIEAKRMALSLDVPLVVVFCLVPKFLEATSRQFGFMLRGLREVEAAAREMYIPFHLVLGEPTQQVPKFAKQSEACAVVTDMSPLRVPMAWATKAATGLEKLSIPLIQVDAHNVVPVWEASNKLEYAARTIRNKIESKYSKFLCQFPDVPPNPTSTPLPKPVDWEKAEASLEIDTSVKEVETYKPGAAAARDTLNRFLAKLPAYAAGRNDPNQRMLSDLSPYYHFGQISAQRCALEVSKHKAKGREGAAAFLEESIVRRELADNFCYYQPNYDNMKCAYAWARESLEKHASDTRSHIYTVEQFEKCRTHDPLWNAAQKQMMVEGKMHGFLRMYWAKKILEWTSSPSEAMRIAILLNDKYSLDGRDPNGYVGVAWSILGIHDQGWTEREVFGKIRFMNYKGCLRKFDVKRFCAKYGFTA